MTGTSAGGMMVENLLCSSSVISKAVTAAVDIIGGAGTPVRASCRPAGKVPLRILHGEIDPVLKFAEATDVDGSPFMSTSERRRCFHLYVVVTCATALLLLLLLPQHALLHTL